MNRPWQIWLSFGLCLAVVLAAMGWVSLTALRLEREQAEARQQAALEENVRLALWRMDSALAPLIGRESARPYFAYSAFYPAERAYTRMFAQIRRGEVLVPSPLLTQESKHILLHFQVAPDGRMTSPQAPTGNMRDLAESGYTTHEKINAAAGRLKELEALVSRAQLAALLPRDGMRRPARAFRFGDALPSRRGHKTAQMKQQARNIMEAQARAQTLQQAAAPRQEEQAAFGVNLDAILGGMVEGVTRPVWIGSTLLLARRVSLNGEEYIQGCRLDWPGIREWLLGEIGDLLPDCDLVAVDPKEASHASRRLAALPIRLMPGPLSLDPGPRLSPVSISLIVAWTCVLLAAGAVAALLLGAVSLSERRGAFVSAVTHELRTPLTTFRMYAEMLAEKMVPEAKRNHYLTTLRVEADRLGHLVENVLAYARLERGPGRRRLETVPLGTLVGRMQERLEDRARQAGMDLVVGGEEAWEALAVRADPSAVEQILFNLVDNACKHAQAAADRRIHLEVARAGDTVAIRVRDHGPGIPPRDRRRLFRPFCKSSQDAAESAPGVGLGLALCRRLARSMGGTLGLDETVSDGAGFMLALPKGRQPT